MSWPWPKGHSECPASMACPPPWAVGSRDRSGSGSWMRKQPNLSAPAGPGTCTEWPDGSLEPGRERGIPQLGGLEGEDASSYKMHLNPASGWPVVVAPRGSGIPVSPLPSQAQGTGFPAVASAHVHVQVCAATLAVVQAHASGVRKKSPPPRPPMQH